MEETLIKVQGRWVTVPSATVDNRTVVVTGRWLHVASVDCEDWLESEAVADAPEFLSRLGQTQLCPDLFTFCQRVPDVTPKWDYPIFWDNVAAIPLKGGFKDWWENRLPQEARKNSRRAEKRGVTTRIVQLSDEVVRGLVEINDERPLVQGKPSRHYGKDLETVRRDYSSFPERSDYIAAYCGAEFIGLAWLVRMGRVATISQLCTKASHHDKRPANALMARTVEFCCEQGFSYLTYGKYQYGKNTESSLMEFKRRLGFEQVMVPRYYVALTVKGRLALRTHLHLGLANILPRRLVLALVNLRGKYYSFRYNRTTALDSGSNRSLSASL